MCISITAIAIGLIGYAWCLDSQEIAQKRRQNEAEEKQSRSRWRDYYARQSDIAYERRQRELAERRAQP